MAPIKYEEQMKDKLEKRSLQPSPESWTTLANRLDAEQKSKNKSLFWWIGIAASIVGVLFVTTIYFNNQPIENDTKAIVNTDERVNEKEQQTDKNQINEVIDTPNDLIVEETKSEEKPTNEKGSNLNRKLKANENNALIEKLPTQDIVAQSEGPKNQNTPILSIQNNLEENLSELKNAKLNFENQKVLEVAAQINALNSNGNKVTNTEIDSLLKKAQREILSNRLFIENTRTVDANALLQDVEEDLEQSFRSKVFETLQSKLYNLVINQ